MESLRVCRIAVKPVYRLYIRPQLRRAGQSFLPNNRGFHATSRRPFLDVYAPTHSLLEGFHSVTSLSWSAVVPLAAVLVFGFTRAPIALYVHKLLQRQRNIDPQLVDLSFQARSKVIRESAHKTTAEKEERLNSLYDKFCTDLRRHHGCQNWKLLALFVKFPVWYVMMETIRRMTGTEHEFTGLIRSIIGKQDESTFVEPSAFLDPSLAAEGMLWFQNLQVGDPNLVLPFMLSATLVICARNGFGTTRLIFEPGIEDIAKEHAKDPDTPKLRKRKIRRERISQALALAAGPATLQFPSAMLLYWISTSLCEIGSGILLQQLMPARAPVTPPSSRPDVKKQQFRGPRMQDLRSPKKAPKGTSKLRPLQERGTT